MRATLRGSLPSLRNNFGLRAPRPGVPDRVGRPRRARGSRYDTGNLTNTPLEGLPANSLARPEAHDRGTIGSTVGSLRRVYGLVYLLSVSSASGMS